MDRYQTVFHRLKQEGKIAFIPFVTLGDPDIKTSFEIISTLIEAGADGLELGFAYSDPVADGEVIQQANLRALSHNITTVDNFALIKRIRAAYPDIPIGLLLYANVVVAKGLDRFYQMAKDAGVDSILVADIPLSHADGLQKSGGKYGIGNVFLAPPNASDVVLKRTAQASGGYVYVLGRVGVTGTDVEVQPPAERMIKTLKSARDIPCLVGFGISEPKHIIEVKASGADGAISGSAIIEIIGQHLDDLPVMKAELAAFVQEMKAAS